MDKPEQAPAHDGGKYYDEIPYPSHPFRASHPDHLHAMATLFKLDAVVPDRARVLELGCASGGNLIPLAVQMPQAQFVGVDLSARQIGEGQVTVDALGLKNIRLLAQDFATVDERFGDFDYIICHGVFSWVPEAAQQRILEICQQRLTPTGVAYISYNAYPGWFMRGMIRQMMLNHVAPISGATARVRQARALLNFIVEALEGQNTPYAAVVRGELDLLAKQPDSYLAHEHLEAHNRPMFFTDFMRMAQAHGLQFLGESSLASMVTSNLPPKAAEALTQLTSDIIQRSQYTDFVTHRMFRQTLLCRAGPALDRALDPSRLASGYLSSSLRLADPAQADDIGPDTEIGFIGESGRKMLTKAPPLKALGHVLREAWPASLSVAEIQARVLARLEAAAPVAPSSAERQAVAGFVATNLLQMLARGDAELRQLPDRFQPAVSERPMVSALVRLQARQKQALTTGTHGIYSPDPLARLLVQALDGSRSQDDLVRMLRDWVARGVVNINDKDGKPVDAAQSAPVLVDKLLNTLRQNALLVA